MSSSAVALGRVAFAALIIGAAPAVAQQAQPSNDPGIVVVQPARVPVPGSPEAAARNASLRPPPPGPIESRLVSVPGEPSAASAAPPPNSGPISSPVFATPPVQSLAPPIGPAVAASRPAAPAASAPGTPLAVIAFAGQSANLTDATRAELDQIAKRLAELGVRHIELRGYAFGGIDGRKVALARALVVRAYLIDAKVKARIEVGSFEGEGGHVEILGPKT
ncbi:Outer membrane protein OmpA [Rhodospirillales bacterium URHD0017]|nr:Outer membrane protein OmpA [Rhodospirillales bacterium URHD0017]